MKDILQDIMIIFDGKILACKIINFSELEDLIGMLISALTSFAEAIHEEGMTNVAFTTLQITLFKQQGIIFFGTSSKKINQEKALKALKKVAVEFFSKFPAELLCAWNGDLNIFSEFEKQIAPSKKELMMEFIETHWPSH